MLNFDALGALRSRLLDSLLYWEERRSDRLFRSHPLQGETPSYTNSGIALQALIEGGRLYRAQKLADRLLENLALIRAGTPGPGVFPQEKAGPDREGHVMSNAWPVFSVLETYPSRRDAMEPIVSWFLQTQAQGGGWSLLPGEDSRPPIITAYALMTLLKFWECSIDASRNGEALLPEVESLKKSIEDGVKHLENCCLSRQRDSGLLLWTARGNPAGDSPVSVGTSAMCIHVLAKWERLNKRSDLTQEGVRTFLRLANAATDLNSVHVDLNGDRMAMWDQLALNEGRLNYLWSFFAPISGVTVLRFAELVGHQERRPLLDLVERFASWIQVNEMQVDRKSVGIAGGATISDPKSWSTALSVVFLSRVLNSRHVFDAPVGEVHTCVASGDPLGRFLRPPTERTTRVLRFIMSSVIMLVIVRLLWPLAQRDQWAASEGWIWLTGIVVSIIGMVLGVTRSGAQKAIDGIGLWAVRLWRLPGLCRQGGGGDAPTQPSP